MMLQQTNWNVKISQADGKYGIEELDLVKGVGISFASLKTYSRHEKI